MKNILHKNQVIITALAIMIAIAGYLNFSDENTLVGKNGEVYEAGLTGDISDSEEAQLTVNDNVIEGEFEESTETIGNEEEVDKADETNEETNTESTDGSEEKVAETSDAAETGNVGEAVLVNSTINLNYFYNVKLNREQTRAKNKEELMVIVDSSSVTEEQKQTAINEIIELTDISERENEAELLLEARGFENSVVSMGDGSVDVVVDAETVTEEQIAQIGDIVSRKTGVDLKNIIITPVNANE